MGQAKLRGTKEERIAQAQDRVRMDREASDAAARERVRRLREARAAQSGLALSPGSQNIVVDTDAPPPYNHGAPPRGTGEIPALAMQNPAERHPI